MEKKQVQCHVLEEADKNPFAQSKVDRKFSYVNFKAKHKTYPSFYGAQTYDAVALLDAAVKAVKGDLSKKDDMRKEVEKANFKSTRGPFKFGKNHIPIQNFYLQEPVKDADGQWTLKTVAKIVENDQDRFHDKCTMK